jgi:hypothetical protein
VSFGPSLEAQAARYVEIRRKFGHGVASIGPNHPLYQEARRLGLVN